MKNFNVYNEELFSVEFKKTDIYKKLNADFDQILFAKFYWFDNSITPRQSIGDKKSMITTFSAVPFYYLKFLLEKNPAKIYDLGCGWNIFKKYVPNVIGIGAEPPGSKMYYADIHDFVDDDFIKGHQEYFESVFSICALHFRPLNQFAQIVNDFYSMIKPGGRGFLALNLKRMIDRSQPTNLSVQDLDAYCRSQLLNLSHIKYLVVDIDLECLDEGMDGNVRLVMEK